MIRGFGFTEATIRRQAIRMTDLVEVSRFGALADAEQRALVLAAVGIEAHLIADTVW